MIFAGAFSPSVSPSYLIRLSEAMSGKTNIVIRTSPTSVEKLKPVARRHANFDIDGWVSAEDLGCLYEQSTCLLSIGEVNGKQVSSKIFGYMSTGKPIVHLAYVEDECNATYLEKYPLTLVLEADATNISRNARILSLFLIWAQGKRLTYEDVAGSLPECTPQAIAAVLTEPSYES